jgi:hypothetical protein
MRIVSTFQPGSLQHNQTDHDQTPIAGVAGLADAGPACGLSWSRPIGASGSAGPTQPVPSVFKPQCSSGVSPI